MRAVTMRNGALGRLELITQIPGHDSIAAAARALYGGRGGALQQMIAKIEAAAGFRIIDRSSRPLAPTDPGRELIRDALQVLQTAREQTTAHRHPEVERNEAGVRFGRVSNPSAADATLAVIW